MKSNKVRRTYLLLLIVIIAAAVLMAFNYFTSQSGDYVEISVDGNVVNILPLSQNTVLDIDGFDGGHNTVNIEDGFCYVNDADCPDKLCIKQGKISKAGETIICLPHRVVVKVVSERNDGLDSMAK